MSKQLLKLIARNSLDAINEVITDEWLSEKFRFQLAKEAIDRNKRRLQTEKRRNKERMEVAKTYKEVKGAMSFFGYEMNEIKFTSSENVLLHVGSSTTLLSLEFHQVGGFKEIFVTNPGYETFGTCFGNQYIYIQKAKLVTLKLKFAESDLRSKNEDKEKYKYEDIHREDFKIIFKPNVVSLNPGLKLSFCLVQDDFSEFEEKKKAPGFV